MPPRLKKRLSANPLNDAESKYRRRVGDVPQPDLQVPVAPRQILESNVDNEVKQVLTTARRLIPAKLM
jgi:hypothetical protein